MFILFSSGTLKNVFTYYTVGLCQNTSADSVVQPFDALLYYTIYYVDSLLRFEDTSK